MEFEYWNVLEFNWNKFPQIHWLHANKGKNKCIVFASPMTTIEPSLCLLRVYQEAWSIWNSIPNLVIAQSYINIIDSINGSQFKPQLTLALNWFPLLDLSFKSFITWFMSKFSLHKVFLESCIFWNPWLNLNSIQVKCNVIQYFHSNEI